MATTQRNFIQGKMNKSVDERLIPNGQYIDALNVRLGSTEASEIGSVENSKGNTKLTSLSFNDILLSTSARCIGAYEDGAEETIYFFVHDPAYTVGATGKIDLIISYDELNSATTYHIISMDDGLGFNTTLNFNPANLITGINKVEDLIFFTDNINPPRFFNVKRNYPNPFGNEDVFTAESILVIKKPPFASPSISLIQSQAGNNYLEDKFLCFAYRYEYSDDDFSATSQWSKPAFLPKGFLLNGDILNDGMVNNRNTVDISFNTGGELVKSIEVLFKESGSTFINVIDKFVKIQEGYNDLEDVSIVFDSNQIFTVLPSDQLGRLYDNVPLLAKAQTLIGNRLTYGNYYEGYNLVDVNKDVCNFSYTPTLISESIGVADITPTFSNGTYTLVVNNSVTIPQAITTVDLSDLELKAGAQFTFDLTFTHDSFGGGTAPSSTVTNVAMSFVFTLATSYSSVNNMINSTEFQSLVGTTGTNQSIQNACTDGTTWTDEWNCDMPNTLDTLFAYTSGIGTGVVYPGVGAIQVTVAGNLVSFQFPAMIWVDDVNTPTNIVFEYFTTTIASATWQDISETESLHSDRDYSVGIVYMDDFNRSSTAILAPSSTVHVSCGLSDTKNTITVDIPVDMKPPSFAKRYKFVLKPSAGAYETIYCNQFFNDPSSVATYFLLEGENAQKVSEGTRLRVKADTSGALLRCASTVILEKKAQQEDFIVLPGVLSIPAGVYAKMNTNDFNAVVDPNSTFSRKESTFTDNSGTSSYVAISMSQNPGAAATTPIDIPAGSKVKLEWDFKRRGTGDGNNSCERRIYELEINIVSNATYANIIDFWLGENLTQYLDDGSWTGGSTSAGSPPQNVYQTAVTDTFPVGDLPTRAQAGMTPLNGGNIDKNVYSFCTNTNNSEIYMTATGTTSCSGIGQTSKRRSSATVQYTIFRTDDTIIFETEPQAALEDVWYEGDQSYPIIDSSGLHGGGTAAQILAGNRTQTTAVSGTIKSTLFNCYAFGNGAESIQIRDSIAGPEVFIGNRVITVAEQDYREAHRFADLTFSGRYSDEANINRLNEFNFSTQNFKNLEDSFGPVQKLFGRKTDILVLQEDKISYVLAGKNLISDAAGGGAITTNPEVLGTQIAREEVYGISNNPESFVCYGFDKYFTDAKRGAVLQLKGTSAQNEKLTVISENGMRGWFRDLFIDGFATQKLGGYDPYMNEFVLGSNCIALPVSDVTENCGVTVEYNTLVVGSNKTFTVELGNSVGIVTVSWTAGLIAPGASWGVTVVYDGVTYNSPTNTAAGSLTFDKQNITNTTATVTIGASVSNVQAVALTVSCPAAPIITVRTIVVTSDVNANALITRYYNYTNGTYNGPLISQQVPFVTGNSVPLVSSYISTTGAQGTASIPVNTSTVQIGTVKKPNDDYVFNVSQDKFGYLRSNLDYQNNPANIAQLITDITAAGQFLTTDVSLAPSKYFGTFTMPNNTDGFLYLVYDLRSSTQLQMCYSSTDASDACCGC